MHPPIAFRANLAVSRIPERGIYATSSAKTFSGMKRAEARAPPQIRTLPQICIGIPMQLWFSW
jgi:hypothetical protein